MLTRCKNEYTTASRLLTCALNRPLDIHNKMTVLRVMLLSLCD